MRLVGIMLSSTDLVYGLEELHSDSISELDSELKHTQIWLEQERTYREKSWHFIKVHKQDMNQCKGILCPGWEDDNRIFLELKNIYMYLYTYTHIFTWNNKHIKIAVEYF